MSSQGMTKLKELLFDSESQRLADLQRHLDMLAESDARRHAALAKQIADIAEVAKRQAAELDHKVAGLSEREVKERLELLRRIEQLFDRAGTEERFTASVARTLNSALRTAEVERHQETAEAMAPLVVRTVKAEIRNSQDELVEALYPMTGRMVKAYVASAMKDLADQINRRLEQNALMLRVRSLTTGRSVAELAMAGAQPLKVEELYLIRRGSGELVARWPKALAGSNRDLAMSGTLAAINEFATDAFKAEGSSLRHIDLDSEQVYLRASPLYLLAAKCHGAAPQAVEQIFDEEFLSTIEANRAAMSAQPGAADAGAHAGLLDPLAGRLETRIEEKQRQLAVPPLGFSPLKALAMLVLVPLIAWAAWHFYTEYETGVVRSAAEQVLAEMAELKGYPTRLVVEPRGRALTVAGLAPTDAARTTLIDRLQAALPDTQVRDQLGVVPSNLAEAEALIARVRRELTGVEESARRQVTDLETEMVRTSVSRSLERAARRLEAAGADLERLQASAGAPGPVGLDHPTATAGSVAVETSTHARSLDEIRRIAAGGAGRADLEALSARLSALDQGLDRSVARLMVLIGGRQAQAAAMPASRADRGVLASAEATAASAERLATATLAALQADALRRALPPPVSARERLVAWTRNHAIFFASNSDYRDPEVAERSLDELAALAKEARALIRAVGYTDDRGGQTRNSPLSLSRAEKVVQALVARGVPRELLVAVGRLNAVDISPVTGPTSPNRRVEFEVGFTGETPP